MARLINDDYINLESQHGMKRVLYSGLTANDCGVVYLREELAVEDPI